MQLNDSDRDWEAFGKRDPYFAVLTAPEFHGALSGSAREKFFESGEEHIEISLQNFPSINKRSIYIVLCRNSFNI